MLRYPSPMLNYIIRASSNQAFGTLITQIRCFNPLRKCQPIIQRTPLNNRIKFKPNCQVLRCPNLTNLNEIGSLLKGFPKISILKALDQTKITIHSLAGNFEQQDAEFWSEQGSELTKIINNSLQTSNKKYLEAIYCFDKAIQLNPNDENNFYQQGFALYMCDQFTKATDCFDMAILLNPQDSNYYYSKGETLFMSNKVDETYACYQKAIQLNQKDQNVLLEITLSLFILNKFKEANDCFSKAIQLNHKTNRLLQLKGMIYRRYFQFFHYYNKTYDLFICTKAKSKVQYLQEQKQISQELFDKGQSLQLIIFIYLIIIGQYKYKEASQCFEDALKYFPNDTYFAYIMKEWKNKFDGILK